MSDRWRYLVNEGEIVGLYFILIDPHLALAVKIIFAAGTSTNFISILLIINKFNQVTPSARAELVLLSTKT